MYQQYRDFFPFSQGIGDIAKKEPGNTDARTRGHGNQVDASLFNGTRYRGNRVLVKADLDRNLVAGKFEPVYQGRQFGLDVSADTIFLLGCINGV
jgi:hypothetical protein